MSSLPADDLLLLIRCPSCSQRFKVAEDLRGKTVECGACEARFKITDEVVVRGRKFYPGERGGSQTSRYQRVPKSLISTRSPAGGFLSSKPVDPAVIQPVSPQRILAGICGVGIMVVVGLMLMFSGQRGGVLDGMAFEKRLVMAGFTSLLGLVMLVYANPAAKKKALAVGLLFATGLMMIPLKFKQGALLPASSQSSQPAEAVENLAAAATTAAGSESAEIQALRNQIGTDPLQKEINQLAREGSSKQAIGLWFRSMNAENRLLIKDYIFRTTSPNPTSGNFYPREHGDFLMVLSGAKQTLPELVEVVSVIGTVEKVHSEISVIEIRVNNGNFTEGPIEKLTKKEDPAFYELNRRELECIDIERVKKAVRRLAEAEPKIYLSDISRKLISLLADDGVNFKGNICKALLTWSAEPKLAGNAALKALKPLVEAGGEVPPEMVELIVKEKNNEVIPFLNQLWRKSPNDWEMTYTAVGPAAEASMLESFPSTEGASRQSVIKMLGKVGGERSLAVLAGANAKANTETRILIEQAQRLIRERVAK
jgi:hypothetical protein